MATTLPQPATPKPPAPAAFSANPIGDALAQVTARLRLVRWVLHASRGALGGLVVSLIAVILAHLNLLPDWLPLEAVLPVSVVLGVGVGTLTAFLKPISQMDAARLAEARLGLKERLSSALEFERVPQPGIGLDAVLLRRLQQEDAVSHARSLKAVEAVPLRLPWETKAVAAGVIVLILALVLPNLPVFIPVGVATERAIVHKTGDKLQKTARLIAKQAESRHLEGTRRVAQNMQRLGRRLAQGRMDKKQAMVQMSKLTQQMKLEQQKMAQQNSGAGAGSKSMALAGQQLAQAMQSASQNSATTGSKAGGGGQKAGGSGSKNAGKSGPNGAGSKKTPGDKSGAFNVPGADKNKAGHTSQASGGTPGTPEMQKAAQAMQQNDAQGLSEQLRQMASRTEAGKMSPAEQQRAAQDLQTLANALKNTPMPETQKHAQAAADAMKRGDKQAAASEMRKAADAAEREAHQQADQEAMQDAQQSVEGQESDMAGANSSGDIKDDSSQGSGQGQGKGKGQGQGQGDGDGEGDGQGLPNGKGKHGGGKGKGGSGGGGEAGGTPSDTGEGSSPLKHLGKVDPNAAKSARLYFGKPLNAGPSKTGPMRKVGSNPSNTPGQTTSNVPYYNYVAPARKSAESTMDKEDIPPAYRSDVRKYFNSLQPATPGGQ